MMRMITQTPIDYLTWGNHEADIPHSHVCKVCTQLQPQLHKSFYQRSTRCSQTPFTHKLLSFSSSLFFSRSALSFPSRSVLFLSAVSESRCVNLWQRVEEFHASGGTWINSNMQSHEMMHLQKPFEIVQVPHWFQKL